MAKLAKISVSRSGTSATITLENFSAGDEWSIYRAPKGDGDSGQHSLLKAAHDSATYSDSGLTSGNKYSWRAAISIAQSTEVFDTSTEVFDSSTEFFFKNVANQKSSPRYSNPA